MALINELNLHLKALDLETMPSDVNKTLERISKADPRGESFRYAGTLPESDDRINFKALAVALKHAYSMVSAAGDMLSEYSQYQSDMHEEYREAQETYMSDQMPDYFQEYGY
jgi:hypothetical protein